MSIAVLHTFQKLLLLLSVLKEEDGRSTGTVEEQEGAASAEGCALIFLNCPCRPAVFFFSRFSNSICRGLSTQQILLRLGALIELGMHF